MTEVPNISLPRMRGDRPGLQFPRYADGKFTPHARGSTRRVTGACAPGNVYPACAGIDPTSWILLDHILSLPRMRGDRPHVAGCKLAASLFTPHARGSTQSIFHLRY